jgi:hypothetical protein
MRNVSKLSMIAAASAILFGVAASGSASAETAWQRAHPRRTEVNHRLSNQDARIHRKVADGQMTRGQAAQAHHEDNQVRQEERDMASQNGTHITKSEDRTLNQQENAVSSQIHHE